MTFRFVHTADWQIGKPFSNISGDAGAELRAQRIKTVEKIAETARRAEADAVLVAGDAFDSNDVADRTIVRTLEALKGFDGPWVFLPGNHDAALAHSVWTRIAELGRPPNMIVADRPAPITLADGRAVVLPAPLRRRRDPLDQTAWFDGATTPADAIRVGLAHGSIAGRLPDKAEAANEIPEDRASRAGLAYLALGDWHGALQVAARTWYSGAPEPDRHRANQAGFIHLVEVDGPNAPERVAPVSVGHYCWVALDVELLDGTCDKAIAALAALAREHRCCVVSLRLTGTISLAERRRLEAELRLWEARLHHLEVDDQLVDEPTADDLDALDTTGFVRVAVERLRSRALSPSDPEREAARMALRMIYLDHLGRS